MLRAELGAQRQPHLLPCPLIPSASLGSTAFWTCTSLWPSPHLCGSQCGLQPAHLCLSHICPYPEGPRTLLNQWLDATRNLNLPETPIMFRLKANGSLCCLLSLRAASDALGSSSPAGSWCDGGGGFTPEHPLLLTRLLSEQKPTKLMS